MSNDIITGTPITNPGLPDVGFSTDPANSVASLTTDPANDANDFYYENILLYEEDNNIISKWSDFNNQINLSNIATGTYGVSLREWTKTGDGSFIYKVDTTGFFPAGYAHLQNNSDGSYQKPRFSWSMVKDEKWRVTLNHVSFITNSPGITLEVYDASGLKTSETYTDNAGSNGVITAITLTHTVTQSGIGYLDLFPKDTGVGILSFFDDIVIEKIPANIETTLSDVSFSTDLSLAPERAFNDANQYTYVKSYLDESTLKAVRSHHLFNPTENRTYMCWVKLDYIGGFSVYSQYGGMLEHREQGDVSDNQRTGIIKDVTGTKVLYIGSNGSAFFKMPTPYDIGNTNWVHLALTLNINPSSTDVKFYIDGALIDDRTAGIQVDTSERELHAAHGFDGLIDECAIYNIVLPLASISAIHAIGSPDVNKLDLTKSSGSYTETSNLVDYFKMGDSNGILPEKTEDSAILNDKNDSISQYRMTTYYLTGGIKSPIFLNHTGIASDDLSLTIDTPLAGAALTDDGGLTDLVFNKDGILNNCNNLSTVIGAPTFFTISVSGEISDIADDDRVYSIRHLKVGSPTTRVVQWNFDSKFNISDIQGGAYLQFLMKNRGSSAWLYDSIRDLEIYLGDSNLAPNSGYSAPIGDRYKFTIIYTTTNAFTPAYNPVTNALDSETWYKFTIRWEHLTQTIGSPSGIIDRMITRTYYKQSAPSSFFYNTDDIRLENNDPAISIDPANSEATWAGD